jgi:hypothetical protein
LGASSAELVFVISLCWLVALALPRDEIHLNLSQLWAFVKAFRVFPTGARPVVAVEAQTFSRCELRKKLCGLQKSYWPPGGCSASHQFTSLTSEALTALEHLLPATFKK